MATIQAEAVQAKGRGQPAPRVIYDGGKPIGQVVEPCGDRVTGRGEGTVLLKR
jgi:hypothetical protein